MPKKKLSRVQERELADIMFAVDVEIAHRQNSDPLRVPIGKVSRAAEVVALKRLRGRGLHVITDFQAGQALFIISPAN